MPNHHEKIAYSGRFVQVKESLIDGHIWEKAYFPDSLVVFPITENNEIIMIEEKRPHENVEVRLKFVTGHIHEDDGDVLETANREMMEEIGQQANQLREFKKLESSGTINSNFHFIVARGLSAKKVPNPDGEDSIIAIHKVPMKEMKKMLFEEILPWSVSTLGLLKILNAFDKDPNLEELFN